MKKLILLLILLTINSDSFCIYTDPGRVAAIELAKSQTKKTIEAQEKAQLLMTTGHIWIKEEIQAISNFQKQFNTYLDNFHDVLSIAAEIYGIYYDVTQTAKTIKELERVIAKSPSNTLALAFNSKRNKVYNNVVKTSLSVLMDVRKVCFESSKMTEWERIKIVNRIRPNLNKMNKQLRCLAFALRYSSFLDIWNNITERVEKLDETKKKNIILNCQRAWQNNAKSIR